MSAVDDLDIHTIEGEGSAVLGVILVEGSLSLAWAQAQDACPEGWRISGIADYGNGTFYTTAVTDVHAQPVKCDCCGEFSQPKPRVLTASGKSWTESFDVLIEKLKALG